MGRKKALPVLEKVKITDIGSEGNAVAKVDGLVVFVPMLIPGDIVDIQVIKKRKKYMEGAVVRFHEYSPDRIRPRCSHFGVCGGCRWQHLPYDLQLYHKEKQVRDNLQRIGKIDLPETDPIIGSGDVYFYRNKLEYTFSARRWMTKEEYTSDPALINEDALGFHIPGQFDKVLDIRECHLQPDPSNAIRDAVRRYAHKKSFAYYNIRQQSGFLRNLIIRNTSNGQLMVIVVFFLDEPERVKDLLDFLAEEFPDIRSLMYVVNRKQNDSIADLEPVLFRGEDHLIEDMDGLKFRIGPKSFYQTNTRQSVVLYKVAREFAGLKGDETVYDLYTGTGTIANFIAGSVKSVIGIEYIEESVRDARINSEINNIKNTKFFSGDIKSVFNESFVTDNGKPDVVITDPPRSGMHPDVINSIISASPEKIVYISCNPSTQARDILLMSGSYRVSRIQPVDMFPQTHHVENIVLLERTM